MNNYNLLYFVNHFLFKHRLIITIMKETSSKTKQGAKNQKKANRYNLIKGSKKYLGPICDQYDSMALSDRRIWHARIIKMKQVHANQLTDDVDYNIVILNNCKEKQNIIYVEEVFEKSGDIFIIQQKYDEALVDLVKDSYPLVSGDIEDILIDVVSGLIELYSEGYATRSLRPEHIVCVDQVWKIQSFVYNSNSVPFESQFCWSPKFASPEDRGKDEELSMKQIDQQLVWNVGILGLYMILGPNFDYEKITKDSSIPWAKVKENVGQSLYRFLVKALKVDFKDRMRLRQLLENQLFQHLGTSQFPFQSYSKFYGDQSKQLKKSPKILSIDEEQKMKLLKNEVERFRYFGEVQKYVQELPYKNNFDICLIRYLSFKIAFENLSKIRAELTVWKRENSTIRDHYPLRQFEEDLNVLISSVKQSKINYAKNIKGSQHMKSEVPEIKNSVNYEIIDEKVLYSEVITLYLKLSGSIYTVVSKQCENRPIQSKQRTICYYSLGAYLIHFYETNKFVGTKVYEKQGIINLCKMINEAPIRFLIETTQNLVREYFATIQPK